MAKESIRLIEEAENAAYEAEIRAQAQAAEIVAEAKQRATNAHAEAVAKAKQIVDQAKNNANNNADALQKSSAQDSMAAAEKLRAEAKDRLSTAVDIVIADIIN